MSKPMDFPVNDSLWQEIIKVREWITHVGLILKVIPPKLFLDVVPSYLAYVTRVLGGCSRGWSVYVSFQEILQRWGDVFIDILITVK